MKGFYQRGDDFMNAVNCGDLSNLAKRMSDGAKAFFTSLASRQRSSYSSNVSKDELMANPEKYRGQGIRFRPPYEREMVNFDDWIAQRNAEIAAKGGHKCLA